MLVACLLILRFIPLNFISRTKILHNYVINFTLYLKIPLTSQSQVTAQYKHGPGKGLVEK